MRGFTKKICPGCDKVPEHARPTTGVCDVCRHKLTEHPALVEIIEKIDAETPLLILDFERHGIRFFGAGRQHRSGHRFQIEGEIDEKDVSDAVQAVVSAFAPEYKGARAQWAYRPWAPLGHFHLNVEDQTRHGGENTGNEFFIIPAKAAEALQTLVNVIDTFAAISARLGVEYGKSMVRQLADGQMTADDFTPEKKERN